MLGSKPSLAILILILDWSQVFQSEGLTVDPPEEVVIHDPGHFGQLHITWSAPASLHNLTDCSIRFQLDYFNTYKDRWTAIRTVKRTYSAQFDPEKDVRVRVYTLLAGTCTNNSEVQSNFTELVQQPANTGPAGSRIQNFVCVFHQMKFMECTWVRGREGPAHTQHRLFFWHRDIARAEECPNYIVSNGIQRGCNFSWESLPDFSDLNICVNGSSPSGPVRPAFFSLQTQNQVKPAAAEVLSQSVGPHRQLEVTWDVPVGRVSEYCLEWEVEFREERLHRQPVLRKSVTRETAVTYVTAEDAERKCFRVRSRVHQYCADRSFWSDWSHWSCQPDEREPIPGQEGDTGMVIAAVAMIVAMLILLLCGWAVWRVRKPRQKKKDESLSPAESTSTFL